MMACKITNDQLKYDVGDEQMKFRDIQYPLEDRLTDLIEQLNIDEQISLLSTSQSAIPRLQIQAYQVGGEAAHGVVDRQGGKTTVFPQPVGLSSTWNRELLKRIGDVIGDEARIFYEQNDKRTGLTLWAPTIDMERDPRWGRTEEAYGEDPYLTGQLSTELIKGMQGDDPFYIKLVAAPKHFFGNNNEYGRERISNSIDPRNRHEYYLKAFEPAFTEGQALSMMTAYNGINGIPAMQINELKDIVRDEWQMDGFIVCDGGALSLNVDEYKYYDSYAEALADAIKKGIDCFVDQKDLVEDAAYEALENGLIEESDITNAIRNMLKVRFRLGHFDDDSSRNPYAQIDHQKMVSKEHAALALEATNESIVLLKNDDHMLPLDEKEIQKVAVIGPTADIVYKDWYTGYSPYQITPLEGIKKRLKGCQVNFVKGNDRIAIKSLKNQAFLSVSKDNKITATSRTVGDTESFEMEEWGWNGNLLKSKANDKYVGQTADHPTFEVNSTEVFSWFVREKVGFHAIDEMKQIFHLSTWQGEPLAISDDEQLMASEQPEEFEKILLASGIDEAVQAAKESDVAIVCVGNNPMLNGRETEDRSDITLPEHQQKLLEEVYKVNQNVVVVVIGSYPFAINWADKHIPAILYSSHGSQMLGDGIAAILLGDEVPSGKLSMTWYKNVNQLPSIFDYDIIRGKRTYMYFDGEVLYPFGHGLSYAEFIYHSFHVKDQTISAGKPTYAYVEIENNSEFPASEVVQLYATVENSAVKRPNKQLINFAKVKLNPHEKKVIQLEVHPEQLAIWDVNQEKLTIESGTCILSIGSSSGNIHLTETIHVQGETLHARTLEHLTSAENYNEYHEVYINKGENNHNCVTNRMNGWIKFNHVEIDHERMTVSLRATTDGMPGKILVKLNGLGTDPIVEIPIETDYPWEWVDVQVKARMEKGQHDILILFEGPVSLNTIQLKRTEEKNE